MRPVPSRVPLVMALVGLLMAAPLLATPPAEAQTISLSYAADAFTYGWTFPDAGDHPGAELEDPAGDLQVKTDANQAPVGTLPGREGIDMLRLRIDEPDREVIRLTLHVADIDPRGFAGENLFGTTGFDFDLQIGGTRYTISSWLAPGCADETVADVCESVTSPALVLQALFYEVRPEDRRPVGYLPTRVLVDEDRMELLIPRWALDRAGPGKAPVVADKITDVAVRSSSMGFCFTGGTACFDLYDVLPDAAPATDLHALALDSNGARLRFEDGRGPAQVDDNGFTRWIPLTPRIMLMEVAPGPVGQVPVRILNDVGPKALVIPSVEILSQHDLPVNVPKSLEVPADDTRRLLVTINGTDALSVEDPLVVRLDLKTVGPAPAYDTIMLVIRAVTPLSDALPRLYLHTYGDGDQSLFEQAGFAYEEAVLNTLADDPADTGRGVVASDFCFCINRPYFWSTQTGLPSTLHLDNGSMIDLHLAIDAPVAGTLMLDPVFTYGDLLVASGNAEVDLEQGPNTVSVPLYLTDEAARLEPTDSVFTMELRSMFRPGGVILGELVAIAEPVNPILKTQGQSWIELPIIDPAERFADATHISVDLGRGVDRVQYLNPGRATLWNVTVLNQADESDTIEISASGPDGWKTVIQPGKRYTLGPGESVTVGVRATAPADAAEGTTASIAVAVRSDLAQGATAGTTLSAVVTSGVVIDEPYYAPDNETSARLAEKTTTRESPSASPFVIVVLLLAFATTRRRIGS